MQVIWCLKFSNMTKSGGQSPLTPNSGGLVPRPPVNYAHALTFFSSDHLYDRMKRTWWVTLTFSSASFVISAENETGTPTDWERLMEEEWGSGPESGMMRSWLALLLAVLWRLRGRTVPAPFPRLAIDRACRAAGLSLPRSVGALTLSFRVPAGDLLSLWRCVCRQDAPWSSTSSLRCLCTRQPRVILFDARPVVNSAAAAHPPWQLSSKYS